MYVQKELRQREVDRELRDREFWVNVIEASGLIKFDKSDDDSFEVRS